MKQEWVWEGLDNVDIFFGQHIVCILLQKQTVTVQDTRSFDRAMLIY